MHIKAEGFGMEKLCVSVWDGGGGGWRERERDREGEGRLINRYIALPIARVICKAFEIFQFHVCDN